MRSATAPVAYAASRHHYQLLYHSQQLRPTGSLSRNGYSRQSDTALLTLVTPNTNGGPALQLHVDSKDKLVALQKSILVPKNSGNKKLRPESTEMTNWGPGGCSSAKIGYLVLSSDPSMEEQARNGPSRYHI